MQQTAQSFYGKHLASWRKKSSELYAPCVAFLVSVAFWSGISGAATSPRWAIASVSLGYLDWKLLPFIAFCFVAVDFDSAVHWAIVSATFCWGLKYAKSVYAANEQSYIRPVFDWRGTSGVISLYSFGIGISGAIAITQSFGGFDGIPQLVHPAGLFLNKNFMGEAACLALIASLQYRLWLPALICVPALILSTSRASWIATILSLLFLLPWRWGCALLSAAVILLFIGWQTGVNLSSFSSMDQRLWLWNDALHNLHWFGSGAYDFSTIRYREPNLHNDFLQLVYEFGIISILLLGVLLFSISERSMAFVVAITVIASFGFPLQMPATAWFAAFMLGHFVGCGHDKGRSFIRPWRPNWRLYGSFSRA